MNMLSRWVCGLCSLCSSHGWCMISGAGSILVRAVFSVLSMSCSNCKKEVEQGFFYGMCKPCYDGRLFTSTTNTDDLVAAASTVDHTAITDRTGFLSLHIMTMRLVMLAMIMMMKKIMMHEYNDDDDAAVGVVYDRRCTIFFT